MAVRAARPLMLDASFVLSADGMEWLTGEGAPYAQFLVVSRAFYSALDAAGSDQLGWFAAGAVPDVGRLRDVLARAELFGHEDVRFADANVREVGRVREGLAHLHAYDSAAAAILLDEWVFLQTQSWLGAKSRDTFEAFAAAGARFREVPRRTGRALVAKTLKTKSLPEHIPLKMLIQAGMKWIAVGGSAATSLVTPPVGAALGMATGAFLLLDP